MTSPATLTQSIDKLAVTKPGLAREEQDLDDEDSAEEGHADVVVTSSGTKQKKKKKKPKKKVSIHPVEL